MQRQQKNNELATPATEPAATRTAPGKRQLAQAAPENHGRGPIQRKAVGPGAANVGDWTDVVFRPDLHGGPTGVVQREAAADGATGQPAPAQGQQEQAPQISSQSLMHWVQSGLNVLSLRVSLMDQPLVVDGKNGPKTRAAIKAFQRNAQALGGAEPLQADGVIGPRTTLGLEAATGTSNPEGRPAADTGGGAATDNANGGATDNANGGATDNANGGATDNAGNETGNTSGKGADSGQGGGTGDVVHEEGKQSEEEKAGGEQGGDAAISAPSSLSSKALKGYFNECLGARYGDKGMLSQMVQISLSSYKVQADPGSATVSENAGAAWQQVASAIDALTTDTRGFSIKLAVAVEGGSSAQYATCTVKFSRRLMSKADDATIAASLITADASHCVGSGRKVAEETYEAFKGLYAAAQTSGFIGEFPDFCKITSAYRSVATQEKLYADKVASLVAQGQSQEEAKKNARKWVASPGGSAHHTGHALDLKVWPDSLSSSNAKKMVDTSSSFHKKYGKYWLWLKENAPKYGFLPYAAEPWHWEKCK